MSLTDGFSPQVGGVVLAQGFSSNLKQDAVSPMRLFVDTNGTTKVNVFGTTNPVSGTILNIKSINRDGTAGSITVTKNDAGTEVVVAGSIIKGTTIGEVKGTALTTVSFAMGGTMTAVSSTAGNTRLEIDFIVSDPRLPGAQ